MLTCKEAAQRVSESLDRPLKLRERFALRWHLLLCEMCSRYAGQMKLLQRACAGADEEQLTNAVELPADARDRILERLRQEQ